MKAPREVLATLGLSKYRRQGHGWVDGGRIRTEVRDAIGRMSFSERSKVESIIEILQKKGGFPADSEIPELVRQSAQHSI
ncbi:MAG: hypothetical protein ABSG62_22485 [Terracidiphilus sp.]|jgi:hypothetical protein